MATLRLVIGISDMDKSSLAKETQALASEPEKRDLCRIVAPAALAPCCSAGMAGIHRLTLWLKRLGENLRR